MPISLSDRLQLAKSDPAFISAIFGNDALSEDRYLWERLGGDYEKYFEMLRDPQVRGKLSERVGAVLGRDVLINPTGRNKRDKDAAAIAQRILDGYLIPYESICNDLMFSGLLIGFSVLAITAREHKDEAGTLILPETEYVPQSRFVFKEHAPNDRSVPVCTDENLDPATEIVVVKGYELRLLTRRAPVTGERCPKDRFICFTFGSLQGKPMGYGIGSGIRKYFEIRNECLKAGVLTGDRLGSPPVHGTYPDDLDPDNNVEEAELVHTFIRLLKAISPNASAATTEGFKINFLEPKSGGHEILKWLYDTSTAEIANAIWGDRSYAEKDTGSYAAESAQNESRNENVTDGDCNNLDEQLGKQLWQWIGDKNYQGANYPHIRRETAAERRSLQQKSEEEDLRGKIITNDRTLIVDFGLQVDEKYIKTTYGDAFSLPEQPKPVEEVPDTVESDIDAEIGDVEPVEDVEDVEAPTEPELSEVEFAANVDRFVDWQGLRIGIRQMPGITRFPQYRSAKKLQSAYGFIQGYKASGKAIRCYVHPSLLSGESDGGLFEVVQLDRSGNEDERKYMAGYPSIESAELAYRREMPEWAFGGIRSVGVDELGQYAEFAEGKYGHINFTPPESVRKAAKRGLELRAKQSPSNRGGLDIKEASEQGIGSGVARARDLANGKALSPDTVRRMKAFFDRHSAFKHKHKSEPEGKAAVSWKLWGGDSGYAWAKKICKQMDAADGKADHAESELSEDDRLLDEYEQRLTQNLADAYGKALEPIAQFVDGIANSEGTDQEKYRRFVDGIYDLYSEMDPQIIGSVLADGLGAGYLAGMYSERVDRPE